MGEVMHSGDGFHVTRTRQVPVRLAVSSYSDEKEYVTDEYRIEWDWDEIKGEHYTHCFSIGCPDCKMNVRALIDGDVYECQICGYTNTFDPTKVHTMYNQSRAERVEVER